MKQKEAVVVGAVIALIIISNYSGFPFPQASQPSLMGLSVVINYADGAIANYSTNGGPLSPLAINYRGKTVDSITFNPSFLVPHLKPGLTIQSASLSYIEFVNMSSSYVATSMKNSRDGPMTAIFERPRAYPGWWDSPSAYYVTPQGVHITTLQQALLMSVVIPKTKDNWHLKVSPELKGMTSFIGGLMIKKNVVAPTQDEINAALNQYWKELDARVLADPSITDAGVYAPVKTVDSLAIDVKSQMDALALRAQARPGTEVPSFESIRFLPQRVVIEEYTLNPFRFKATFGPVSPPIVEEPIRPIDFTPLFPPEQVMGNGASLSFAPLSIGETTPRDLFCPQFDDTLSYWMGCNSPNKGGICTNLRMNFTCLNFNYPAFGKTKTYRAAGQSCGLPLACSIVIAMNRLCGCVTEAPPPGGKKLPLQPVTISASDLDIGNAGAYKLRLNVFIQFAYTLSDGSFHVALSHLVTTYTYSKNPSGPTPCDPSGCVLGVIDQPVPIEVEGDSCVDCSA